MAAAARVAGVGARAEAPLIRAALLLVLAATATAEVTAPLGRRARPGVPIVLKSDTATVVDLDGWRYDVDGFALVMPPHVPCVVRDGNGTELFRLSKPDAPYVGRALPEIPPWCRPALRVFDAVEDAPLGSAVGAPRPDLYDLVLPPAERSDARAASRLIVAAAAAAMAVLLLLRRRGLLVMLGALAAVATVVGWVRTQADYRAVAAGRIEVRFQSGERARLRTYWIYRAAGPGGVVSPPEGAVPVLRRVGESPWWAGPGPDVRVPQAGSIRVFATEEAVPAEAPPEGLAPAEAPLVLKKLWRRERPANGAWTGVLSGLPAAPVAAAGKPPVLLRLWIAAQD